jgi:hypothetical protein
MFARWLPKPEQVDSFKSAIVAARTTFWILSILSLCYLVLYKEVLLPFSQGSYPVTLRTLELSSLPIPCAYICGQSKFLHQIQVEILNVEKNELSARANETEKFVTKVSGKEVNSANLITGPDAEM